MNNDIKKTELPWNREIMPTHISILKVKKKRNRDEIVQQIKISVDLFFKRDLKGKYLIIEKTSTAHKEII